LLHGTTLGHRIDGLSPGIAVSSTSFKPFAAAKFFYRLKITNARHRIARFWPTVKFFVARLQLSPLTGGESPSSTVKATERDLNL